MNKSIFIEINKKMETWGFFDIEYASRNKIFSTGFLVMNYNPKTQETENLDSFMQVCPVEDSEFEGSTKEFWFATAQQKPLKALREMVNCENEEELLVTTYQQIQSYYQKYIGMSLISDCTVTDFGMFDERHHFYRPESRSLQFILNKDETTTFRRIEDSQILIRSLKSIYGNNYWTLHNFFRLDFPEAKKTHIPTDDCLNMAYTFFTGRYVMKKLLPEINKIKLSVE